MKAAKMKGAYGMGMARPAMLRISSVITMVTQASRNRNFLSFRGRFIVILLNLIVGNHKNKLFLFLGHYGAKCFVINYAAEVAGLFGYGFLIAFKNENIQASFSTTFLSGLLPFRKLSLYINIRRKHKNNPPIKNHQNEILDWIGSMSPLTTKPAQ